MAKGQEQGSPGVGFAPGAFLGKQNNKGKEKLCPGSHNNPHGPEREFCKSLLRAMTTARSRAALDRTSGQNWFEPSERKNI